MDDQHGYLSDLVTNGRYVKSWIMYTVTYAYTGYIYATFFNEQTWTRVSCKFNFCSVLGQILSSLYRLWPHCMHEKERKKKQSTDEYQPNEVSLKSCGLKHGMKSPIFWNITPWSPLKVHRRFAGTCLLHTKVKQVVSRVPPKRRLTFHELQVVITQKIDLFLTTAVRTSNPNMLFLYRGYLIYKN
jgi:hypothetical protein